ncbi:MAG: cytochrome c oxidase subunit I [Rhodothermales bacterium]
MNTVTQSTGAASQAAEARRPGSPNYLNHERGLWSWLTTIDHKRIGVMYAVAIATFFLVGGLLAMLVRLELFSPGETLMGRDVYNQVFTLHAVIMIFLFIIPGIPAVLGNFVMPIHIGAKDVAFPRLNLASWYLFMLGALVAITGIVLPLIFPNLGWKVDTGWTFYTPYSSSEAGNSVVLFMTTAVFIAGFASILTGLNFIVTVHKMRAPGMTWNRLPLFVWAIYATAIVQVLATPVIGITMVLLFLEKALQIGIFDPALGGDPVLFQHFFWFYSHPAVYIMILPAMGVISELMGTFSRQKVQGYTFIALSSVAIAFLGFLVWGHHMFVAGQSAISSIIFSLLTYLIGIPTGIKVFNWVATMYKGSVWLRTPMLYALMFLFLFTIGGFTGIMVGVLAVDVHLHDTYFVVAHFHYTMMGGAVIALLGGLHYWWPKITGKMYNEVAGRMAAVLIFVGFNITFFSQFILGSRGMPRRYHDYTELLQYNPEFEILNQVSTYGSFILAAGLFLVAGTLLWSLAKGKKAPANPWGAVTLEWTHTTSPPDPHNFHRTPLITRGPYDFYEADDVFGPLQSGDGADDSATPVAESSGSSS